ncbi:hypothetical protein SAMN04488518_104346 [Pseudovibrio ascidiaceicola]|uniref:Uncharacterized protein n=1 Tax=Pseudovibrio ascidiaceicola TaxID=285279 RepID=A0A1I3Z1V5_9HYPH|nr:hypothetical protein [Pseudovibrio ascidiaceicola]SFK37609.1 hypothetical protein SAMN04488518_104346 [Pseudovibrio ascidiaceicola]
MTLACYKSSAKLERKTKAVKRVLVRETNAPTKAKGRFAALAKEKGLKSLKFDGEERSGSSASAKMWLEA